MIGSTTLSGRPRTLLAAVAMALAAVSSAQIATYNISAGANAADPLVGTANVTGLTVGNMTRVGVTAGSSTGNFRASNWPLGATNGSNTFTGVIDAGKYIQFSLTPNAGYAMDVTSISFGAGRSATGPRQFAIRSSADGFATNLAGGTGATGLTFSGGVYTIDVDLSSNHTGASMAVSGPGFTGLTSTLTFRVYGFNSEASAGTGGLAGNLVVNGSVVSTSTSVSLASTALTVAENVGTTPITVNITNPDPVNATTVDLVLTSGNAARINNYTTQTVTFPANSGAAQNVTITVTDNGVNDGDATLVFQLQNVAGGTAPAQIFSPSTYTLTVTDNDSPPVVSVNSVTLAEGNSGTTNAVVSVTMNAPPASNVVVALTDALTGTATSVTDYGTFTPASLTFTPTDTYPFAQSVTIPVFGDTDVEPNETVNYTLGITSGPAVLGLSTGTLTIVNDDVPTIFINEVDADQTGTDNQEFIELYGTPNASLTGTTLVFYNGSNDLSYASFDLDGFTLDANGFFVVGNTAVPGVDLVFTDNILQNGADAVALYYADATSFPLNTAVTTTDLIDALVYDTDDADDAGLLVLLNGGQAQINENANLLSATQTMSRVPDGGTLRNTDTYVVQGATPGATNVNTCDLALGSESVVCTTVTPGPGDTYSVSIPYTGSEPGVTVVNNSGSGTVGGDDPAVVVNGTIVVSGITEGTPYSITFSAPCGALVKSGSAPACEPLPEVVINEVDYDQAGTDNAEWIELRNNGATAVDLNGYKVELVNGSAGGAAVYKTIVLPSFSLAPGAYYVIGNNAATPNINLIQTPAADMIQNGAPDAIGLRDASNNLLDAISYEGTSGAPYQEGGGTTLADPGTAAATSASIVRFPDGADTDNNTTDWALACNSTPGASNTLGVDTDGDTFLDCLDGCPLDPAKQAPGQCGCGVPDTDTDGDLVADCNDLCPTDPFKIAPGDCGCGNPDVDTDGDLISDCIDNCVNDINPGQEDTDGDLIGDVCDVCPLGPNPGLPCNDNNPFTTGDLTQNDCSCVGTPAPSTTWTLEFTTDNAGSESTWQIVDASSPFVLASGGPYASNTTTTIPVTVPTGACFNLIVTDANGMSSGTTGGWVLRDNNGRRVIDNAGDGVFAGTVQAPLPFCSPVGNDVLLLSKCDKVDWLPTGVVIA
ncbi:MAG: lamin tail domain-containing protein, partial [Flavobacteriales bacterium]|nr:lamin tail domain-containing protein [Flavobacteriales bacterium]